MIKDLIKSNLDIIIPCYNARDNLFYTLSSISIQKKIEGFKVYIVNDKSSYDYSDEVKFFSKFFDIEEIKLDKNLGPGGARREGLNHSNSKYVMFIDSDDILYDCNSLYKMYSNMEDNDLLISSFYLERDGVRALKKNNLIWLHGKMYKREFLDKNNITFNDSRANEDNGFNRLIIFCSPKRKVIDDITYVYRDNKDSITRKDNRNYKIFGLEGFVYNMKWAIEEGKKRGCNPLIYKYFANNVLVSLYYDYLYYIDDKDVNNILMYAKDIIPYYEEIPKNILDEYMNDKEKTLLEEDKKVDKTISFDEFLKKVNES